MAEVEIKGLDELQRTLERMPKELADKLLKETLGEQGNRVREAFASAAPSDTGFLSEHFNVKMKLEKEVAGSAFIGPNARSKYPIRGKTFKFMKKKFGNTISVASVARFLEFGTSRMAAKPFLRPAWEGIKDSILDGIINAIREKLATYAKH